MIKNKIKILTPIFIPKPVKFRNKKDFNSVLKLTAISPSSELKISAKKENCKDFSKRNAFLFSRYSRMF